MNLKPLLTRLSLKKVFVLIVTIELIVLTSSMGMWQWSRAQEKWRLEERVEDMKTLPALSQLAYLALDDPLTELHRRVILRGKWLHEETIYLDNRAMNSQAGFWVITPLALNAQDSVLVQRGWIPRNTNDRTQMASFETPSTEVQIEARITQGPSKMFDLADDKPLEFNSSQEARSLRIRQNVELKAFAKERALHLIGNVVEIGPNTQGLRRDWPVPASTAYKNVGYTVQWFAMSLLLAILYIWYQIIKPKRDAKRNPQRND
jgi:cytochrome oxidase assembly protein ShyY1